VKTSTQVGRGLPVQWHVVSMSHPVSRLSKLPPTPVCPVVLQRAAGAGGGRCGRVGKRVKGGVGPWEVVCVRAGGR